MSLVSAFKHHHVEIKFELVAPTKQREAELMRAVTAYVERALNELSNDRNYAWSTLVSVTKSDIEVS